MEEEKKKRKDEFYRMFDCLSSVFIIFVSINNKVLNELCPFSLHNSIIGHTVHYRTLFFYVMLRKSMIYVFGIPFACSMAKHILR